MKSFNPTFQERAALAAGAKQKALEKLRERPVVDEAVLAERRAARLVREAAEAEVRSAKRAAREQAAVEKAARTAELLAEKQAHKVRAVATEADRKLARDMRYAARKKRT